MPAMAAIIIVLVNIIGGADLTLPKVNELMSAITEQFGRESHIIMGAVIDEGMQNRVEVCVLGTSGCGKTTLLRNLAEWWRERTDLPLPLGGMLPASPESAAAKRLAGHPVRFERPGPG